MNNQLIGHFKYNILKFALKRKGSILKRSVLFLFTIFFVLSGTGGIVEAATLTSASASLSDSRVSATAVSYTLQFSSVTTSLMKCMKVEFLDAVTAGSKPTGMTITSLALSASSNYVPAPASWSVSNNNSTGVSSITFATGATPASASSRTVILTGITNGSVASTTYFIRFSTYNNVDCVSSPIDNSTTAFIYTNGQTVSATIDPILTFSVSGVASGQTVAGSVNTNIATTSTTVPFGTLSASTNRIGAQDLSIATNAGSGYTITVAYTGPLSNGSGGTVTDWTGTNAAPTIIGSAGTSAFGYTTDDLTLGTGSTSRFTPQLTLPKWAAFTTSPLEIGYSAVPAAETIRVGYIAGISTTTPAGSYVTTVIYIVTPIY